MTSKVTIFKCRYTRKVIVYIQKYNEKLPIIPHCWNNMLGKAEWCEHDTKWHLSLNYPDIVHFNELQPNITLKRTGMPCWVLIILRLTLPILALIKIGLMRNIVTLYYKNGFCMKSGEWNIPQIFQTLQGNSSKKHNDVLFH